MSKRKKKALQEHILRTDTHKIDTIACNLFASAIPSGWILNALQKDYGKDFHVEIQDPASEAVTGRVFYVQLKGTRSLQITHRGHKVAFPMELRYSKYYADEVKLPVFLVVIDVDTGNGYWLFTQEYLRQAKKWRSKSQLTYKIPVANTLANIHRFGEEITRSIAYMRANAVSYQEKMKHDITELKSKDNRFEIIPTITLERTEFRIIAREPVDLKWQPASNKLEVIQKFKNLFDGEEPVSFAAGEIQVSGSPIFDRLFEEGATIQVGRKIESTASLVVYDPEGREAARIDDIRGHWRGNRALTFNSESKGALSFIFGPLRPSQSGGKKTTTATFRFDPSKWKGQHLLHISHFDRVDRLYSAVAVNGRIDIQFDFEGHRSILMQTPISDLGEFLYFQRFLLALRYARAVAAYLHCNPIFDKTDFITEEKISEIAILHDLVTKRKHVFPERNIAIAMELSKTDAIQLVSSDEDRLNCHALMPVHICDPLRFLGEEISIDGLYFKANGAQLVTTREELESQIASTCDSIKVKYIWSPGSGEASLELAEFGEKMRILSESTRCPSPDT